MRQLFLSIALQAGIALAGFANAAEFHVRPDGTAAGDGSAGKPWDLATALSAEAVKPGDTVWLHGGTYRGGFVSTLRGLPDKPVTVAGARSERATIDAVFRDERDNGLLVLRGADVVYRDFEVTCSDPVRKTKIAGPWPADIRRGNVDVRGDRIALVNLVLHDCSSGVGLWAEGEGGEVSGCLMYAHGWSGPDRGHGHAIYAQNARGVKRIVDNVLFHQFGYGIHVYGSEKASLRGFEIEGNIVFDNGCLVNRDDRSPGILVGGGSPAGGIVVRNNVVTGGGIRLGYPWGPANDDVVCTGNHCEGLVVREFRKATVTKNTIVAHSNPVTLESSQALLLAGLMWNHNDCWATDGRWGEAAVVENGKSRGMSFDEWRRTTGCDKDSRFTKGEPKDLRVVVRPNRHERGRGHVAVLNPAGTEIVEVDLSSVLVVGRRYRVQNVKDYYGKPVARGTYAGGKVRLPMTPLNAPPPIGWPAESMPVSEPRFAAFVVLTEEGD